VPITAYAKPRDDLDYITSDSIWNDLNKVKATYESHEAGLTTNGALQHQDPQITIGVSLAEVGSSQVQNPATQRIYNDGTWGALSKVLGAYPGLFMQKVASLGTDTIYNIANLLRQHNHADNTHGGQLAQANTHLTPDTDSAPTALHHTIGTTANQAAAGNHTHLGPQSYSGTAAPSQAALILHNAPGDPAQTIVAVQNNAGTTTLWGISPTAVSSNIPVSAPSFTGPLTGNATGVTPGAIVQSMMANSSVGAAQIIDGSVGTSELATGSVTSTQILDGTITGTDIGTDTITATNIAANAITASELADASVDTAAIQDGAITPAKLAAATTAGFSAVGHKHGANGEAQIDGSVQAGQIIDRSIDTVKLNEGSVTAHNPPNTTVWVNALRKWNDDNSLVLWPGGWTPDLTQYIPATGSSTYRYILIAINSTPDFAISTSTDMMGSFNPNNIPHVSPNTTPVAVIQAYSGMLAQGIQQSDILGARMILNAPQASSGSGSGGPYAPVNHVHGQAGVPFIFTSAMDEARVFQTNTPSYSVNVEPFRYRGTDGVIRQQAATVQNASTTKPTAGNFRIDLLYFDTGQRTFGWTTGATFTDLANPSYPAALSQYTALAYIHYTSQMTYIRTDNDNQNGWCEDARAWLRVGGVTVGAGGAIGVADGGTGANGFNQGLVWQADPNTTTTPLIVVPADALVNDHGLSIKPTANVTAAAALVDIQRAGNGALTNGSNVVTTLSAFHITQPTKQSGAVTNMVGLNVDLPTIGTNNASAILSGPVRVGGPTMPGAGNALDVTGAVQMSSTLQVTGTVGHGAAPAATTGYNMGTGLTIVGPASGNAVGMYLGPTIRAQATQQALGLQVAPAIDTTAGAISNAFSQFNGGPTRGAGSAAITNAYSIYTAQPSIGTNNWAAYFGGTVGIFGSTNFPGGANTGACHYRNDTHCWYYFDGTNWNVMDDEQIGYANLSPLYTTGSTTFIEVPGTVTGITTNCNCWIEVQGWVRVDTATGTMPLLCACAPWLDHATNMNQAAIFSTTALSSAQDYATIPIGGRIQVTTPGAHTVSIAAQMVPGNGTNFRVTYVHYIWKVTK